jgi:hypothetical protein
VRDGKALASPDPRLPLVVYNMGSAPRVLGELRSFFPPAHPLFVLAGSGDREFVPQRRDLSSADEAMAAADDAATILLPARDS